jgi:HAD superfamily hydrolase (TIGR01490 family)
VTARSASVAFFDVDETVIRVKSMFDFLEFWYARDGADGDRYASVAAELRALAGSGIDRSEVNRAYYRNFAGVRAADLEQAGTEWYAAYRELPDSYVLGTLARMADHKAAGTPIVLVSGSFRPVLQPLAADLGADHIVCTEPDVGADGRLTGTIRVPMIGIAKADGVLATAYALGADPESCFCYGDHHSDLDMLRAVGHPCVIAGDPALGEYASAHGWPMLPSTPGRLPSGSSARSSI